MWQCGRGFVCRSESIQIQLTDHLLLTATWKSEGVLVASL